MWPLLFTVSLSLIYSLVAGHTDNFILFKHLADEAHVQLDLTGKQSYAIYEQQSRKNLFQMCVPYNYHMRLINGHVKCDDESNCDFVGYAIDIRKIHSKWSAVTGAKNFPIFREEPWMYNHYYDRKLKKYVKLPQSNHYVWAGLTKDVTHQQIYNIGMYTTLGQHFYAERDNFALYNSADTIFVTSLGEEWCKKYPMYSFFFNNCHHFVYDLYKEIKQ